MAILVLSDPLPSASFVAALRAAAPDTPVWDETDTPRPSRSRHCWPGGSSPVSWPVIRICG